ncbi:MAG: hypothetical protein FJ135_16795 [Deltaproteobacteria bacterium]|nr:hypothetical protein [Deltaproteobacteria bacterium]
MLLSINTKTRFTEKKRTSHLQTFGFDERALQEILFKSLDRLFPDDELILLMQSRHWQEEPDLMAIDKNGDLYIFELKAWESQPTNLLQVLRYGQIYGPSKYPDLDAWFKKITDQSQSLKSAHKAKFGVDLLEDKFNQQQIFVVMTNGLDYKTREVIQYWRSCNLDVRPWVYRIYEGKSEEMLLEISAFRVQDNPYEDLAEGYYILNTNYSNDENDHNDMLKNGKAAAYFDPWKYKIERLSKGDVVFLYQSGVGIVAVGEADGKLCKAPYQGNPDHPDEEYFRKLLRFQHVNPPMTAAEIKRITGVNYVFMQTMFGLDADGGKSLRKLMVDNGRITS